MHRNFWLAATASSLLLFTTQSWSAGPAAPSGPASDDPVVITPLRNNFCRALAPAGWSVIDQDNRGATYSVASPDKGMIAAYGVSGISKAQMQGYYGPQYRRPALFAQYLAETLTGEPIGVTGSHAFNDMVAIDFESNSKHGFVIYRAFQLPSNPGGYVIAARIAIGANNADVPVAGAVAASIDCNTTFKEPPSGGYAEVDAKASDVGTSEKCKAGSCNDSDLAGTYNVQLGTGYAHSASGTNYLVDVASDYRETGPDGPGYYRQAGNALEKLEPGRWN
jgi:hypothetical protein